MLRKGFVVFLAFSYLVISCGFTLNFHYCLGRLYSVNLSDNSSCICNPTNGLKTSHRCCKNTKVKVELKQKYNGPGTPTLVPFFDLALISKPGFIPEQTYQLIALKSQEGRAPPHNLPSPYYLLFHSFRI